MMECDNVLKVRMLGGFSASWNGTEIAAGAKSTDTQLIRLFQLLIHRRNEGVDRKMLMQVLDDDSKSDDVHHLMRTVIYNLRHRLKKAGLPPSQYITYQGGRYCWAGDIPVLEDTSRLESLYEQAEKETDPAERERLFTEACFTYTGEFLPEQMRLEWVSEEHRRYQEIFEKCVVSAADLLRERGDFAAMERLGRHAAKVSPFNEWESLTLEALAAQGKYREAQRLYETAAASYQKEMGVRFSIPAVSRLHAYTGNAATGSIAPEDIRKQLRAKEPDGESRLCPYPVFEGVYRAMSRHRPRDGRGTFLLICTLAGHGRQEDGSEAFPRGRQKTDPADRLETAILSAVEQNDIICRYSGSQFLVMLAGRTGKECEDIGKTIDRTYRAGTSGAGVEYTVSLVTEAAI